MLMLLSQITPPSSSHPVSQKNFKLNEDLGAISWAFWHLCIRNGSCRRPCIYFSLVLFSYLKCFFFFFNLNLKKKGIGATLSGLQYLPWPGIEPGPPQWKAGILTTRPWWLKKCTTWALQVKFYLGQNEDCSPGGSISDSAERLLQIKLNSQLPSCTSFLVDGYGDRWSDPE